MTEYLTIPGDGPGAGLHLAVGDYVTTEIDDGRFYRVLAVTSEGSVALEDGGACGLADIIAIRLESEMTA